MNVVIPAKGQPTSAMPGTEFKIIVMRSRADRRESIFHPLDQKLNSGGQVIVFTTGSRGRKVKHDGVEAWDEKEYLRQHDHEDYWREHDRWTWNEDWAEAAAI